MSTGDMIVKKVVVRIPKLIQRRWNLHLVSLKSGKKRTKQKVPGGCPRSVMVKAMDCGIVVSEFVLQSHYYIHFRANTLGKGMSPLILPAIG